jgi:hypothetical protein
MLFFGFRYRLGRLKKSRANPYDELRAKALGVTPNDLNVKLDAAEATPYGILMETGRPTATVTLVSFSTGDASLYFSTGGGVIGGVGHESVRTAAQAFVNATIPFLAKMQSATETPTPSVGTTRFYVLTTRGIVTAEAVENDLGQGKSELSPLFHAGQDVITQIRLSSGK